MTAISVIDVCTLLSFLYKCQANLNEQYRASNVRQPHFKQAEAVCCQSRHTTRALAGQTAAAAEAAAQPVLKPLLLDNIAGCTSL